MEKRVFHTLKPVFNESSKILILGSMPSPKSRELGFYYANPQNRFWKVMQSLLGEDTSVGVPEKTELLLGRGIALWDVLAECLIQNAADSTIKEPKPNNLRLIFEKADIRAVFTTGSAAYRLYCRFGFAKELMPAIALPSTSGANCRMSMDMLLNEYRQILEYI